MRRAILVILALATLGLAMWALMPRAVEVEVATVAARTINVTIAGEGKSEIREVFTVSAPIAGRMQRISLHAGDAVMAEDTVALLGLLRLPCSTHGPAPWPRRALPPPPPRSNWRRHSSPKPRRRWPSA
ncbi:hypothetical protein ACFSHQ_26165 [Gemmobacter lanyuensis]